MDTTTLGAAGEYHAARHYRAVGFQILTQNYKTRFGELDFVAQKGRLVVVVEVKLRKTGAEIQGREAVTQAKQQKILLATQSFLQETGLENALIRFDVVEVEHNNGNFTVNVIENAFEAG